MNPQAARVIDLLTYIEEVEKLKRKPVYVVPSESAVKVINHLGDEMMKVFTVS